jgi:hypothetical protein
LVQTQFLHRNTNDTKKRIKLKSNIKLLYIILILVISTICAYIFCNKPITKQANEIFRKTSGKHIVIPNINIAICAQYSNPQKFTNFAWPNTTGDDLILYLQKPYIFDRLENNTTKFVKSLMKSNFATESLNNQELAEPINVTLKKYDLVIETLCKISNSSLSFPILLSIANKFFEFCFDNHSNKLFIELINNPKYHPILRFIYTTMQKYLASTGWRLWNLQCIKNLKSNSLNKKEIVYLAGGTDIYTMLECGIYKIRIIDPLFPTQNKFYAHDWKFLIKGKIEDKIIFPFKTKPIVLKRAKYKKIKNSFSAKLSTNKTEIFNKNITTWNVFDEKEKNLLGSVTFERRLITQNDFKPSPEKTLLISFNELFYTTPSVRSDSWGIDAHKFHPETKLYIKQLCKPVTKNILCNFSYAITQRKFTYIKLGTEIN